MKSTQKIAPKILPPKNLIRIAHEPRDMFQSHSGIYPGPTEKIMKAIDAIDDANKDGLHQHVMAYGGTWGQAIAAAGFNPFGVLNKTVKLLENKTPVSMLMRGDVGLAMQTLSKPAVNSLYEEIAKAADGHPLHIRMFTAQNTHNSMRHSIEAIESQRAKGARIDLSIECSYKEGMPIKDIIKYMVESAKISHGTIGVKDYSGVLKPDIAVEIYKGIDKALKAEAALQLAQGNEDMSKRLSETRIDFHCHATMKTLNCDAQGNKLGDGTYEALAKAAKKVKRPIVIQTIPNVTEKVPSHPKLDKNLMDLIDAANTDKLDRNAEKKAAEALQIAIEANRAIMMPQKEIPMGNGCAGGGELQRRNFGQQVAKAYNLSEDAGQKKFDDELVKWMNEYFTDWQGVTPNFSNAMQLTAKRLLAESKKQDPLTIEITKAEMEGIRSVNPQKANEKGLKILESAYRKNLGWLLEGEKFKDIDESCKKQLLDVKINAKDGGLDQKSIKDILQNSAINKELHEPILSESRWHKGIVEAIDTYDKAGEILKTLTGTKVNAAQYEK